MGSYTRCRKIGKKTLKESLCFLFRGYTSAVKYRIINNQEYQEHAGGMMTGPHGAAFVDTYRDKIPMFFDADDELITVKGGVITNEHIHKIIGNTLPGQTMMWINNGQGFGFYQAGTLNNAFIFNPKKRGLKSVELPRVTGQLINANAIFTNKHLWFFTTTQEKGEIWYKTTIVGLKSNTVLTQTETKNPIYYDGAAAAGNQIFLPSGQGLIRLTLTEKKNFQT